MSTPKWEVSEMNGCGKSVAAIVAKPPLLLQTIYWCFAPILSHFLAHSRFVVAKLTFLSKRLVMR
ncbi:TPA: hypothetical protein I6794_002464 [Vibrio cholerae]|uniref:hypothetical protein n=1 Tax=Vibrio cholerae TaxID=666 RepID=UPI00165DB01F|nr:hypothetical protein [Vibrio cholerae]ELU8559187.1 hypothetical protein [Vibrio cholerae]MCX9566306.1 hypothetical protein [Vibrio cholerae]MCX9569787.1 hypothetical protein [Vibrio cholerae]MCX9587027.1 hypothetical protein [Vibrio cholerae]HAS4273177.1 hypothetical protein [Vibrio cholerae]